MEEIRGEREGEREQNVCVHGPGAVVGCGPPHSAEVQACVSTEAQLCRDLG